MRRRRIVVIHEEWAIVVIDSPKLTAEKAKEIVELLVGDSWPSSGPAAIEIQSFADGRWRTTIRHNRPTAEGDGRS